MRRGLDTAFLVAAEVTAHTDSQSTGQPDMKRCQALRFLAATFPLRRPGDESLVLRVEPQTSRFQYGHAQEWFFLLAGENQRAAGSSAENFDHSEADGQILFGAIGELIGAPRGGPDAELAQHAGRKKGVRRPGIHERRAFPGLARSRKRS